MSEETNEDVNQHVVHQQQAASSSEQMIPKSRFDEMVANAKAKDAEANYFKQLTVQLAQNGQQRQAPRQAPEDPALRELKERDPQAYKLFKAQNHELMRMRQVQAEQIDLQDRQMLFQAFGKTAEKYSDKVEERIQQLRQNGVFNVNRGQVLKMVIGEEKIMAEYGQQNAAPQAVQAQAPIIPQTVQAYQNQDAPASDPRFASPIASGTATGLGGKSREEAIKALEDVEF